MTGFIYKITNDINNKIYIGQTSTTIEERFNSHKKDMTKRNLEHRPLYNAMNKYGIEHFSIELIEEVEIKLLGEREKFWIQYFDSYHNGYNATLGGDGTISYDYDFFVQEYENGKPMNQIAQENNCHPDTVAAAIKKAGLDNRKNVWNKQKKSVIAKTIDGKVVKCFESRAAAVRWLQENNYTTCQSVDGITTNIGRVISGKRATAYGFKWENGDCGLA